MAQAKHIVVYEGADDAIIDAQALREVYLAPFKAVVDAGVASIMCAYNRINGIYSCGNEEVLERTLRDEYGFKGFVTSDWGATHGAEFIKQRNGHGAAGSRAVGPLFARQGARGAQDDGRAEVDDLVEIMTVGVPEEQRYPLRERDVGRAAARRRVFPKISAKHSHAAACRTQTSIARPRACSGRWSGSAGSIARRGTR